MDGSMDEWMDDNLQYVFDKRAGVIVGGWNCAKKELATTHFWVVPTLFFRHHVPLWDVGRMSQ